MINIIFVFLQFLLFLKFNFLRRNKFSSAITEINSDGGGDGGGGQVACLVGTHVWTGNLSGRATRLVGHHV